MKYNFQINCVKCHSPLKFALSNDYWTGTERFESAKMIMASEGTNKQKQDALAKIFSPFSYQIVDHD
jgi:hypothetical protein